LPLIDEFKTKANISDSEFISFPLFERVVSFTGQMVANQSSVFDIMADLWLYVDAYDCLNNANGDPPLPFRLSPEGIELLTQFKHERFYEGLFGDEQSVHIASENFFEMLIEEIELKLSG